jgi:hypothetical protein
MSLPFLSSSILPASQCHISPLSLVRVQSTNRVLAYMLVFTLWSHFGVGIFISQCKSSAWSHQNMETCVHRERIHSRIWHPLTTTRCSTSNKPLVIVNSFACCYCWGPKCNPIMHDVALLKLSVIAICSSTASQLLSQKEEDCLAVSQANRKFEHCSLTNPHTTIGWQSTNNLHRSMATDHNHPTVTSCIHRSRKSSNECRGFGGFVAVDAKPWWRKNTS